VNASDRSRHLAIAQKAANDAAALLATASQNLGPVRGKSNDRDLVTLWDERAEDTVRAVLARETPDIAIFGEERGASNTAKKTARWLVDPIDGTVNFVHGIPFYAVSIGLEVDGLMEAGVVLAPVLGWNFSAQRGGGAFRNGEKLQVSAVKTLNGSALATGFPYDRAESKYNFPEWEHMQCVAGACRRFGAASLDLAMVAAGWLDGYWESRLSPWDLAAGILLVTEAGGTVSNFQGGTVDLDRGEAIASNGVIHAELLRELKAV
jgi:myo-inositol-1(or 4)-monophosphatase